MLGAPELLADEPYADWVGRRCSSPRQLNQTVPLAARTTVQCRRSSGACDGHRAAAGAGSGVPLPAEITGAAPCAYCAAGPAWLVPLMFLSSSCARAARALSSFIVSRKNCAMSFSPVKPLLARNAVWGPLMIFG